MDIFIKILNFINVIDDYLKKHDFKRFETETIKDDNRRTI